MVLRVNINILEVRMVCARARNHARDHIAGVKHSVARRTIRCRDSSDFLQLERTHRLPRRRLCKTCRWPVWLFVWLFVCLFGSDNNMTSSILGLVPHQPQQ